jgi:ribosomal protein S18 acetylase RimI-like enzyme
MIAVVAAQAADLPTVRTLLDEYAAWLGIDLSYQSFDREYRELPGEYAPPAGALLIALSHEEPAGMVALRGRGAGRCEMKRLWVRPSARGLGVGRALVDRVLVEARERGYREIVLDTLPVMGDAQRLYERAGFHDVEPYYDSPVPGTRFMRRAL